MGASARILTPRASSRLRRLVITRDASVWYTDYAANALGRYDPKTGSFREWETPDERAGPYAIASDSDGRIWYVETSPDPNLLVGFDPVNETIFSITPIPSGGGAVRIMVFDPSRNSLWFGNTYQQPSVMSWTIWVALNPTL